MNARKVTSLVHAADAGTERISEMPVQSQSSLDWSPTRSPHDVELVTCGWRRSRLDEKESALTLRREEDAVQRRLQVGGVVCSGDSDEEKGAVGDAQKTQHAVLVVRLRLLPPRHRSDGNDPVEESEPADDDRIPAQAIEDGEDLCEGGIRVGGRAAEVVANVRRVVERVRDGPVLLVRMGAKDVEHEHSHTLPDAHHGEHVREHPPARR